MGAFRRWCQQRRREADNRAAIRRGRGLVSMDVPPPVPALGPIELAEGCADYAD